MVRKALVVLAGLLLQSHAYPHIQGINEFLRRRDGSVAEWTAMGDSYASGVGAGPQPEDQKNRCFRFPNAYPNLAQDALDPKPAKYQHVACSGNTFDQIKDHELLDQPQDDGKNGIRPAWGEAPAFVTITMGGNDIGILNLIVTCILSFKLWGQNCEQVIQSGHDIIDSQKFKDDLDGLIKAIIDKGRGTSVGDKFKVFVVGYAQFFNQQTTQCNDISFEPNWNPLPQQKLTIERRTAMNGLALDLNKALAAAVEKVKTQGVFWVDYDSDFETHRFCDREEPSPDDPETYFFNYYTKDDPKQATAQKLFESLPSYQAAVNNSTENVLHTDEDFINALADAAGDDPAAQSVLSDTVRMFHPSTAGHEKIQQVVIAAIKAQGLPDGGEAAATPTGGSSPTAGPEPVKCHGIGGDIWMLSRDQAVSAAEQFCKQDDKDLEYFQGSANSVKLSAHNSADDSKPISSISDCVGKFTLPIDSCDGNDPVNNPHNYKFGGSVTDADGWTFVVQPTAEKPTEDSCDVSYKLVLDRFEVRGKNFPDAKLGANGEGLKEEIAGCGAITDWGFEWTPDDVKYQWYASGNLPIGTKSCMGKAVQSAGGTSDGNCHGAG